MVGRDHLFSYKDCPYTEAVSEIDGTNFKIDAYITKDPEASNVILSDAAAIAEFKINDDSEDVEDVGPCGIFASIALTLFVIEPLEARLRSRSDYER